MSAPPIRVLITGGAPAGGVASFAEALAEGFAAIDLSASVIAPHSILQHWSDLRNPAVLKILSTTAVFAAPFARNAICVAHGFPRADAQGWIKMLGILGSYKLARRAAKLVAVSHYAALHLRTIFNLSADAVIHNPLGAAFLERSDDQHPREYITYVGRLHPAKRLDCIFPALRALLHETTALRVCIIGDGVLRAKLEALAKGNPRIELTGNLPPAAVRGWLRRTRIFISGCETEALGISYLEALSQGCVVAMPASGGGLEIVPEEIGKSIRLLPLPLEAGAILPILREALTARGCSTTLTGYHPAAVAAQYLALAESKIPQTVVAAHSTNLQRSAQ